jgi:ABC-type phosphate/phosphonate transport system substrate-binding protein
MADRLSVSDKTSVSMPIKNMIGIIFLVASFVFAYAQITSRLTSLETKDELMSADLLKKAEQTPKNLEIYMLIEHNATSLEKITKSIESMMNNRLNIDFLKDQVLKLQKDVESLKDKVRENKNGNN